MCEKTSCSSGIRAAQHLALGTKRLLELYSSRSRLRKSGGGRDATFCVLSLNGSGWRCFREPFNDETQNVASLPRSRNPLRDEYSTAVKMLRPAQHDRSSFEMPGCENLRVAALHDGPSYFGRKSRAILHKPLIQSIFISMVNPVRDEAVVSSRNRNPCASRMSRTSVRPMPCPSRLVLKKGVNRRWLTSEVNPSPSFSIVRVGG